MKKRERGILTVEASIVLMLVLLFILFLFSFGNLYRAQNIVSHAALQSADAVAMESFLRETALQSDAEDVVYLSSFLADSTAISADGLESLRSANLPKIARAKFVAAIAGTETEADVKLRKIGVKNGLAGIDFSECKMDLANDDVIIAIQYTLEMQFPVFGFNEITVTKAAKAKTFGEILFEVATQPNNPGWGSTSGDSKVTHGSTVQIKAIPNYGYKFVKWSDGATDNPRTVTVTDAQKYVAIFEKDQFGINLGLKLSYNTSYAGISHIDFGTVTGGANYAYLDNATITATPKAHYQFVGWDDNGDGVVDNTNPTRTIKVDKTYHFKAIFKPVTYTVTVKSNNNGYGTAQASQGTNKGSSIQAEYGSKVQLAAVSKDTVRYIFSKWSNNSTQAATSVVVNGNATYQANFITNTYTVTFYNGSTVVHRTDVIRGSSINGSKSVISSSMPANPTMSGVTFKCWVQNGTEFKATTDVNGDIDVKAQYQYTVQFCDTNKNMLSSSITKIVDEKVTMPSVAKSGYDFSGWRNENSSYSVGQSYAINKNVTLTGSFVCNHKSVTGSVGYKLTVYYKANKDVQGGDGEKDSCTRYRINACQRCGHVIESTTAAVGSNHADVWAACNTEHFCNEPKQVCRNSKGETIEHTRTSKFCIRCQYCARRQNRIYVYVPKNKAWEWRYAFWCGQHGGKDKTTRVDCPGIDAIGGLRYE